MHRTSHMWPIVSSLLVALTAILVLGGLTACNSTVKAGPLPTATTGDIQIAISKSQFGTSDPVGVTVTNSSNHTYYAVTGRSGCTYLQMQEYNAAKNTWVNVFGCSGTSPTALQITSQLSIPFTLAPNSPDNENAWDPGTYRVAMIYSASSDGSSFPILAFSPAFTIVSS